MDVAHAEKIARVLKSGDVEAENSEKEQIETQNEEEQTEVVNEQAEGKVGKNEQSEVVLGESESEGLTREKESTSVEVSDKEMSTQSLLQELSELEKMDTDPGSLRVEETHNLCDTTEKKNAKKTLGTRNTRSKTRAKQQK